MFLGVLVVFVVVCLCLFFVGLFVLGVGIVCLLLFICLFVFVSFWGVVCFGGWGLFHVCLFVVGQAGKYSATVATYLFPPLKF